MPKGKTKKKQAGSKSTKVRKTFFVKTELIESLRIYCFNNRTNASQVVNTALERYIK